MSTAQFRLIAACCWLAALCLAIFMAASISDYMQFHGADRVTATVARIEGRSALLAYEDHGAQQLYVSAKGKRVGDTVPLLVQPGSHRARTEAANAFPVITTGVLVLGLGLTIWLGVWLWRRPILAARRRATRTGPLDAVVDAVARTRNISFGIGAFLVAAAGFFVVIMVADAEAKTWELVAIAVLTVVTLGSAVLILRRGFVLRDPHRNPITDMIEHRPHEIGWFYVHRVVNRGLESLSIHVWNQAGKNAPLAVVREDIDAVIADLSRRAPAALQGYSKEHKLAYKQRVAGAR